MITLTTVVSSLSIWDPDCSNVLSLSKDPDCADCVVVKRIPIAANALLSDCDGGIVL
jgi:hypothetical protein